MTLFHSSRVLQFEANESVRAKRDEEEGDSDDDAEMLEFRRQEAGAYTQQRLAVVMVVTAAHSSAVARRVAEKLHQVYTLFSICYFPAFLPAFRAKWVNGGFVETIENASCELDRLSGWY